MAKISNDNMKIALRAAALIQAAALSTGSIVLQQGIFDLQTGRTTGCCRAHHTGANTCAIAAGGVIPDSAADNIEAVTAGPYTGSLALD